MTKFWHTAFQLLATAVQYANVSMSVVPIHFQPLVAALVGLTQAGIALYNHKA